MLFLSLIFEGKWETFKCNSGHCQSFQCCIRVKIERQLYRLLNRIFNHVHKFGVYEEHYEVITVLNEEMIKLISKFGKLVSLNYWIFQEESWTVPYRS